MLSTAESLLEIVHLNLEQNQVWKNETTDSPDPINLNSDHSLQTVLFNNIESNGRCGDTLSRLVNSRGEVQDKTLSAVVDSLESVPVNGTEVDYCEILNMTVSNEADSGSRSKKTQWLGSATSMQASYVLSNGKYGATVDSLGRISPSNGTEVVYCEILDMMLKSGVNKECKSKEIQQLDFKSSTQASIGALDIVNSVSDRQTGSNQVRKQVTRINKICM